MYTNFEIASVLFEICIVREPATTPGSLLLLARDTGRRAVDRFLRDAEDSVKCGTHWAVENTPAG